MKHPLVWSEFNGISVFLTEFRETLKWQFWWTSVKGDPSSFMRTDIETDTRNPADAFRNIADAHNKMTLLTASQPFLKSVHNSCIYLDRYNSFSTIWRMQNMWSVMIGYVRLHTKHFEIFHLRVEFSCTKHRWVMFSMQVATVICLDIYYNPSYHVSKKKNVTVSIYYRPQNWRDNV